MNVCVVLIARRGEGVGNIGEERRCEGGWRTKELE